MGSNSNGYSHLNTAHMWSSTVAEILLGEGLEDLPWVRTAKLTSFQAYFIKFID
jgi:hypothetical protein